MSAKAKGRALQKWVCAQIANMFNVEYKPEEDNCPIHSREMGQQGTDIVLRSPIREKFPFDIECKNTEKLKLYDSINQAINNTNLSERDWLLVHKKNYSDPVVIMSWDAFEKLIRRN